MKKKERKKKERKKMRMKSRNQNSPKAFGELTSGKIFILKTGKCCIGQFWGRSENKKFKKIKQIFKINFIELKYILKKSEN